MAQDERWERRVRPQFAQIVSRLKARSLLNLLFSERLIESRDVIRLKSTLSFPTEEDVATELLLQVLPRAGPGAFDKFCKVLMNHRGQEEIAKMLMREEEGQLYGAPAAAASRPPPRPIDGMMFQ